jgi:lipopolysaccharide/colanic/teichoic acid biosynthesis glycosyltransferase
MPERRPETNAYLFSAQKRSLDLSLGFLLMNVMTPVELAVQHKLGKQLDGDSPYYRHLRGGNVLSKLRTMNPRPAGQGTEGFFEASSLADPRIPSPFAAQVRKYRLDELPQLGQVVFGAPGTGPRLSLVGLRPLEDTHVEDLHTTVSEVDKELADLWRYHWLPTAPQGVISVAAMETSNRQSNADFDPVKDGLLWVQRDVKYCETASLLGDLQIITRTAGKLGAMAVQAETDELYSHFKNS